MIRLQKMTKDEFGTYFENKLERYADVLADNIHEHGEEPAMKARKLLNGLLPNGMETPNHHLFHIESCEKVIGYVWLKIEEEKKSAFLYEIYLFEAYRGQGFGTVTMKHIEDFLLQKEIAYFKLHVFGRNTGARRLYEELGFEIAGINMLKPLSKTQ